LPDTTPDQPDESRAPRLDYEGDGLASVLYYLAEIDSPALGEVVAKLRDVLAGFDGFEFNSVGADRIGFSVRFEDARGTVAAANLSDGTLSLIGLLVLLMAPTRPSVLFLEEPENGLTPKTTRAIYEALVAAAHGETPSQIVISSHSPFVITEAWNGEDRGFLYQLKVTDGGAVVRGFETIVQEHGIHLRKEGGERRGLSLATADQVMDGYYS
jgi:predicted ATPase